MEKNSAIINELRKRKLKIGEKETAQFQKQLTSMFSLKKVESDRTKIISDFSEQLEIAKRTDIPTGKLVNSLKHLHDTWMHDKVQDSEVARVICPILSKKLSEPLFLSLIGDHLTYFKNHEDEIHSYKALQMACLAGSSEIGNYLLEKYSNYITQDFILPFSISSGNDNWVKSLAAAQIDKGLEFPKTIYLYGDSLLAKEIENMFLKKKTDTTPTPQDVEHVKEVCVRFNDQLLSLMRGCLMQESEKNKQLFFQEFERTFPQLKITILLGSEGSVVKKVTPLS